MPKQKNKVPVSWKRYNVFDYIGNNLLPVLMQISSKTFFIYARVNNI